jgi:hypothetical protein
MVKAFWNRVTIQLANGRARTKAHHKHSSLSLLNELPPALRKSGNRGQVVVRT